MTLRAGALCTVAQFNADTGNTDNAIAERMIDAASAMIAAHLGRPLGREVARVEKVAGYGTPELYVALTPVESIASITIDGYAIDPAEYALTDPDTGMIYGRGCFSSTAQVVAAINPMPVQGWNERAFEITYTGGFDLPNDTPSGGALLPQDIVEAALMAATAFYRLRGRDPTISQEAAGNASRAFNGSSLPTAAQSILSSYRRIA